MPRELSVFEKSLLQNINKQYGDETPMVQLKEEADYGKPRGYIDTGIYALNWIISGKLVDGGYPVGRITELDGDPGTGKSLLCEIAMKDPTIDHIIYFDTEAAMNIDFLKFLGVDYEKVLYEPIDTVEQLLSICEIVLDTVIKNKQGQKKILMVIDSIALASTEKEMNPDAGSDMGYKARKLREFFRKFARRIEKYNIALLVTNHYTQKIGVMFGPTKTTTGGTALPYAASVRLDLKVDEIEADKKLESLGASSVRLRATTMKNRCFSPRRRAFFKLDFERGVNKYGGLLKILLDLGVAQKNGGWRVLPGWDPEKSFYEKDFPQIVEENNLFPLVQQLLDEALKRDITEVESEVEEEAMEEIESKEIQEAEVEAEVKKRKKKVKTNGDE
jgi:recombination protein RecA